MMLGTCLLSSYRVLDLGGIEGLIAGRMFALLDAEVIQVEPPGGGDFRAARELGSELPLSWIAYGAGRRSVVIDFATASGRAEFLDLVATADFLIGDSDQLARAGFSHAEVEAANPWLIQVDMTGFGTRGPKRDYVTSDLVLWAASGVPWQNGGENEEPLRISVPQAWLHAAMDGAVGALIAHFDRLQTGRGQIVRTSVLRSATAATLAANLSDFVGHPEFRLKIAFGRQDAENPSAKKRPLDLSGSGAASGRTSWQALDGSIELHLAMGPATGHFTNALFRWIGEEGVQGAGVDWDWTRLHERILAGEISEDDLEAARSTFREFVRKRTLAELAEATVHRRLLIAPCFDIADLAKMPQFEARRIFGTVSDDQGQQWRVPQSFAQIDGQSIVAPRNLPQLGELSVSQAIRPRHPRERAQRRETPSDGGAPLRGLKVVDLSWVVAGPMMGRVLAEFGAEVIRVESRKRPDPTRRMAPFYNGDEDLENSAIYQNVNVGKTGITLDLTHEKGREVLLDLVRRADVVIESYAPGQMEKWGLDYAALRKVNPAIVLLSTSLAGHTGPWSRIAGFGNIGSALSGILRLVAQTDGGVRGPVVPYTDFVAPRLALFTLLAAVDRRRRTGKGARIDVSQVECGIFCIAPAFARYSADGTVTRADGNRDPGMSPHGVFRCQDANHRHSPWVAIAIRNDEDWQKLAQAMDRADLANDARYATAAGRLEHGAVLEEAIQHWVAGQQARDVERTLQAVGVPAHIVASAADLADDAHVEQEGIFVRFKSEEGKEIVVEASRYSLSRTHTVPLRAAPSFGRDTQYILSELLGYDSSRIKALADGGILS